MYEDTGVDECMGQVWNLESISDAGRWSRMVGKSGLNQDGWMHRCAGLFYEYCEVDWAKHGKESETQPTGTIYNPI